MKTNMKAERLADMLREANERSADRRRRALEAVDAMVDALPNRFVWPPKMRRAYDKVIRILI